MKKEKRFIIDFVFVIYVFWILKYAVFRTGWNSTNLFSGRFNMEFMASYQLLIRHGAWSRVIYLFGGNIIGFMPVGLYFRGVCKCKWITTILIGILFSAFIELLQYVLGTGVTELDDLCLNTLGVFLGAIVASIYNYKKQPL